MLAADLRADEDALRKAEEALVAQASEFQTTIAAIHRDRDRLLTELRRYEALRTALHELEGKDS
jgi:chaperonin cofactor prefoldin